MVGASRKNLSAHRICDVIAVWVLAVVAIAAASGWLLRLDTQIILWVQSLTFLGPYLATVTHGGDTVTMISVTAIVSVVMYFLTKKKRAAATLWLNVGTAYLINTVAKVSFGRSRPAFSTVFVDPGSYSFPSGHAMVSTAVYGLSAYMLAKALPRYGTAIRIVAVLLVLSIGVSRMYLDAHWPSDVLAGFAVGWLLASGMMRWYGKELKERKREKKKEKESRQ